MSHVYGSLDQPPCNQVCCAHAKEHLLQFELLVYTYFVALCDELLALLVFRLYLQIFASGLEQVLDVVPCQNWDVIPMILNEPALLVFELNCLSSL